MPNDDFFGLDDDAGFESESYDFGTGGQLLDGTLDTQIFEFLPLVEGLAHANHIFNGPTDPRTVIGPQDILDSLELNRTAPAYEEGERGFDEQGVGAEFRIADSNNFFSPAATSSNAPHERMFPQNSHQQRFPNYVQGGPKDISISSSIQSTPPATFSPDEQNLNGYAGVFRNGHGDVSLGYNIVEDGAFSLDINHNHQSGPITGASDAYETLLDSYSNAHMSHRVADACNQQLSQQHFGASSLNELQKLQSSHQIKHQLKQSEQQNTEEEEQQQQSYFQSQRDHPGQITSLSTPGGSPSHFLSQSESQVDQQSQSSRPSSSKSRSSLDSRLSLKRLGQVLGSASIEETAEMERNILEVFEHVIGFPLGHRTWIRDTTEQYRNQTLEELLSHIRPLYPRLTRDHLETVVKRATYSVMQGRLRKERRAAAKQARKLASAEARNANGRTPGSNDDHDEFKAL